MLQCPAPALHCSPSTENSPIAFPYIVAPGPPIIES